MKFGFVLPYGDARVAAECAEAAERSGWDGFFVWEPVWGVDAWVALTAAAMRTRRIRLGTMISPLSRMRPWKLASEAATLDNLSGGRVILSVGLGYLPTGFAEFGEESERRTRAELLDEALDIVTGLWRGQPFAYEGRHYTIEPLDHYPPDPPVQKPRIPIWVVGMWPRPRSVARAARYDGILPEYQKAPGQFAPIPLEEFREMCAHVGAMRRDAGPFEFVKEGTTPGDDPDAAIAVVEPWREAGATWWIESLWPALDDPGLRPQVLTRIGQGPPHGH